MPAASVSLPRSPRDDGEQRDEPGGKERPYDLGGAGAGEAPGVAGLNPNAQRDGDDRRFHERHKGDDYPKSCG